MGRQNKELLENLRKLDEKEKAKQQKSKILSKTTKYCGKKGEYR